MPRRLLLTPMPLPTQPEGLKIAPCAAEVESVPVVLAPPLALPAHTQVQGPEAPGSVRKRLLAPPQPSSGGRSLLQQVAVKEQEADGDDATDVEDSCYKVSFTRTAHKKRCKYENGVATVRAGRLTLYSEEGKQLMLGKTLRVREKLPSGRQIFVNSSTVIEIESEVPMEDFTSGRAFASPASTVSSLQDAVQKPAAKRFRALADRSEVEAATEVVVEQTPPGALLLGSEAEPGCFLDPGLSRHLRPHQEEGIRFMFQHIRKGSGCILADSMGLGKTLQALCLIWSALSKPSSRPLCRKAVVVCPSSLCGNWAEECERWLGQARLRPVIIQGGLSATAANNGVSTFLSSGKLLIISYEQLRSHADALEDAVDLLVCDEGHRLKSGSASTTKRLNALKCKRRVMLTGTPLQNNLDEFWCCITFVHPSLLPPLLTFQRVFKKPIDRSQDASASAQEVELGRARSGELAQLAAGVILRRGPELLQTLLPPRTELQLTVPLTPSQAVVYAALCNSGRRRLIAGEEVNKTHLGVLNMLRQLCTVDPKDLTIARSGQADSETAPLQDVSLACGEKGVETVKERSALAAIVNDALAESAALLQGCDAARDISSKLHLLETFLAWCRDSAPRDGIVIVSGYNTSLDHCGEVCSRLGIPRQTLTGATPVQTRMDLVNNFNRQDGCRVFLLSSRAGGVGLNIIGANRLIMLEPDWNPAVDLQAMGRIWRQGQKKPCYIYRLAAFGTVEEKVLQRQVRKQGLASVAFEGGADDAEQISDMAELRQVFNFDGYCSRTGRPIHRRRDYVLPDMAEAAGLTNPALRASLYDLRLLNSAETPATPPESMACA